ncbi:hypothetical protein Tco_0962218 [Tanacetum coccineum]
MSSAWKTTDTRDAPSSSSKQKTNSQSEQPIEDVPIPDNVHISDTKDTDVSHLPKIKPRPDWLKHVLEEERSETPKPDWAVPLNDLCEPDNNLANAIAKSYKDPEENKLLQRTGDIGGPPGQVTIQPQYFFNKDLEYLISSDKDRRHALSISKLKDIPPRPLGYENS